jgi:hypothetical protein
MEGSGSVKIITNPDPDSGGPKTYRSSGSRSGTLLGSRAGLVKSTVCILYFLQIK